MIIFSGVELAQAEPFGQEPDILIKDLRLLSGKIRVDSSSEYGLKIAFRCHTKDFQDYINLLGLIGSPGTLTVDNLSYTKCYIDGLKIVEDSGTDWTYDISFRRDTT